MIRVLCIVALLWLALIAHSKTDCAIFTAAAFILLGTIPTTPTREGEDGR